MAEATLELRHLLASDFKLFDFDYQFDDANFKNEIEQAIIDQFYFNEIGQETPDRFKHRFMTRFKRIIPYYNELYNTTLLSYNPLVNYTINEGLNQLAETTNNQENIGKTTTSQDSTATSNNSGTTTNSADTSSESLTTNDTQTTTEGNTTSSTNDKENDFPDTGIAGATFLAGEKESSGTSTNTSTSKNTGTVDTDTTSHSEGTTTSSDTGTSTNELSGTTDTTNDIVSRGTNKSNYEKTIEGLTGTSYQTLVRQERDNLLRILDRIIDEMKPSFYLIY